MVKMAVLGCGKIVDRFIKGLRMCDNVTLVGFGSNNIEKAREYCERYGASVYGDYDRIMNDPDIDAIYVSNFNQAHYRTVKSCLQHGKHVLCEHPLVPTMDELNELFELAKEKDLLLMEACKGTFLPMITEIKELIEQGKLGKIIYVHASDSSNALMPENHWLMQPYGGGAAIDVGVYPVGALNRLFGTPENIKRMDTPLGEVNGFMQAIYNYGDIQAHVNCGKIVNTENKLLIYGDKGYLFSENYWKTGDYTTVIDGVREEHHCEMKSDFYYETAHFANCIEKGIHVSPIMSHKASADILKVIG